MCKLKATREMKLEVIPPHSNYKILRSYIYSFTYKVLHIYIYIYSPCLMLLEHSVGSNANNTQTLPLAVHSRHVATKPLWLLGVWAHWIVFMASL